MAKKEKEPGYEEGRQEGARLLLDSKADEMQALAGRLTHSPGAVGALNECVAILRDAAADHAFGQDPQEAKQRRVESAQDAEPVPLERRSETSPEQSQRAPGDPLDAPDAPEQAEAAAAAASGGKGKTKAKAKA